jgi:phosphopantothenoylcysteine synthetase/decarboxylase
MRPILLVGGAPRLAVDAVRYLSVRASGATAVALRDRLAAAGRRADLLLGGDAIAAEGARRYVDRAGLEDGLRRWIAANPVGVVVLSAAINDYRVSAVERVVGGAVHRHAPGDKVPSGADELVVRLVPADKVIDRLRPEFGLRGPLVAFKYQDAETVLAAAEALRRRVAADLVVANSLCGAVQTLVDATGSEAFASRAGLVDALAGRLARM